jgi:hypothetical protein
MTAIGGFAVSGGLIFLYMDSSRQWIKKVKLRPFKYLFHVITDFVACGLSIFAAFALPDSASSFSTKNVDVRWFIKPVRGVSSLLWGVIWWVGLESVGWRWHRRLEVTRVPYLIEDDDDPGQYVQLSEVVDHAWVVKFQDRDLRKQSVAALNSGTEE